MKNLATVTKLEISRMPEASVKPNDNKQNPLRITYYGNSVAGLLTRTEYQRIVKIIDNSIERAEDAADIAMIKARHGDVGGKPIEKVMEEFKSEGKI